MLRKASWLCAALLVVCTATVAAQGNPTGTITGQVTDPDGLVLPGVTVTAESPALQGTRSAVTSENGDYIIPFLPSGSYTVTFELAGFQTQRLQTSVGLDERVTLSLKMSIAALAETVTVTSSLAADFAATAPVASTYRADQLERLPVGRTLNSAVLLAPGVNNNGPGGNITISGSMSFENLFLINGVVVNENLRGQALSLFIEDSIQETKVTTGSVSAEYGRFAGGVINMVTKSGGNNFSGSFRTTFTNDSWRALTPYPADQTIDKTVPQYEATLGGPVFRDRLWFFGAMRFEDREENRTLRYTNLNYTYGEKEARYEGKLTYQLAQKHTFRGAYTKINFDITNRSFGTVMDRASFYDRSDPQELLSLNYTGVLTPKLFVEGQYSNRQFTFLGSGSRFQDLIQGTPIWDRSRSDARYNSPTFCAVCGSGKEERDNWNAFAKVTYFLSTEKTGSHNLVAGFDTFKEKRQNNNYQSGSSFRIRGTSAIIDGETIYPVWRNDRTTWIYYMPLVGDSTGNDLRTYSAFVNDVWRFNDRWSFNVGLRYDRNVDKDQAGLKVTDDDNWSPRLAATWDVLGTGDLVVNTGYARYVTSVNTNIADSSSAGGRTATYIYDYLGPAINTGSGPYLTSAQALDILFNWFNANGGTDRSTRSAPSIPGVTSRIDDKLISPNVNEYTIGVSKNLGNRGAVRADFVYRNSDDFYSTRRDLSTGRVSDQFGRQFDLAVISNTNVIDRTYKGLNFQANGTLTSRLRVGGNYTLSWAKGNFTGETESSGPDTANVDDYPEYRQESWNYPTGWLSIDQRHKARLWADYMLPVPEQFGQLQFGVLQRIDSGTPYSADGSVDPRPYITNPGYLTPPSSITYYFGERGEFRNETITRTDLVVNWSKRLNLFGRSEVFFRGQVLNLFNQADLVTVNNQVFTRVDSSAYQAFNPFTTQPEKGVHWDYGPNWGTATGVGNYQSPREFSFSVGFRF